MGPHLTRIRLVFELLHQGFPNCLPVGESLVSKSPGLNWEIGIDIYTPLCIKEITNENLMFSTGNPTE